MKGKVNADWGVDLRCLGTVIFQIQTRCRTVPPKKMELLLANARNLGLFLPGYSLFVIPTLADRGKNETCFQAPDYAQKLLCKEVLNT